MKKGLYTSEYFIDKAIAVHGDKYRYDKTVYELARIKVCITCPEHGDFYQTPNSHLNGNGCPKCGWDILSKLKTKRVIINCTFCGKEIKIIPYRAEKSDSHFCNNECRSKWIKKTGISRGENNPTWKGGDVKIPCAVCGNIVERHRYLLNERDNFFCSKECFRKFRFDHRIGIGARGGALSVKCHTCGREFIKERNQVEGRKYNFCDRKCWAAWRRSGAWSKENSPTYKPELTDEERYWRSHIEPTLGTWVRNVKIRDNMTCHVCGAKNKYMIAHHINSWNKFKELRVDLSNGVCLCKKCHDNFHEIYKRGNNTAAQLEEFSNNHNEHNL